MRVKPRKAKTHPFITENGITIYLTAKQIAERLGLTVQAVYIRLKDGDSLEEFSREKHEHKEVSSAAKRKARTRRTRQVNEERYGYMDGQPTARYKVRRSDRSARA